MRDGEGGPDGRRSLASPRRERGVVCVKLRPSGRAAVLQNAALEFRRTRKFYFKFGWTQPPLATRPYKPGQGECAIRIYSQSVATLGSCAHRSVRGITLWLYCNINLKSKLSIHTFLKKSMIKKTAF